jgi:hypothetical protein
MTTHRVLIQLTATKKKKQLFFPLQNTFQARVHRSAMEASISVINMSFSQKTNFPLPTFQLNTNGQKVFLKRQQKQKKIQ